jgi:hypothetical protein
VTSRTTPPLRLVVTLSAELEALGVPHDTVARARAYETDHRRLSLIERAARELFSAWDAFDIADVSDDARRDAALDREEDAIEALRDHLGRWA